MDARTAMRRVQAAHLLEDASEALAHQMRLDTRDLMAMHVSTLRLVSPERARYALEVLYDLADRYGFVPRNNVDYTADDDLPF